MSCKARQFAHNPEKPGAQEVKHSEEDPPCETSFPTPPSWTYPTLGTKAETVDDVGALGMVGNQRLPIPGEAFGLCLRLASGLQNKVQRGSNPSICS